MNSDEKKGLILLVVLSAILAAIWIYDQKTMGRYYKLNGWDRYMDGKPER